MSAAGRVLSLGEQDFSFSIGIAKFQQKIGVATQLVASSYLAEHDPNEPEVHLADDKERAEYCCRKTCPLLR